MSKQPKIPKIVTFKTVGINHVETGRLAKEFRLAKRVTLKEVSDLMGYKQESAIVHLEKGRNQWSEDTHKRYVDAVLESA